MSAEAIFDYYGLNNAEGIAKMDQWLSVEFPKETDKATIYRDPFDYVNQGINLELRGVAITNGAEQLQ